MLWMRCSRLLWGPLEILAVPRVPPAAETRKGGSAQSQPAASSTKSEEKLELVVQMGAVSAHQIRVLQAVV